MIYKLHLNTSREKKPSKFRPNYSMHRKFVCQWVNCSIVKPLTVKSAVNPSSQNYILEIENRDGSLIGTHLSIYYY